MKDRHVRYLGQDARALALDLAAHLRNADWLAFTEIEIRGTGGRVDVAAVKPHAYAQKDLRAYEIKVSKSDFRSDDSKNKWRRYLQVFHRVYFAAPAGLLAAGDIPADAGLIVKGPNGWHVVKGARGHNPPELDADAVLSLLYHGYHENREIRRLTDRVIMDENLEIEDRVKHLGYDVSKKLALKGDATDKRLRKLAALIDTLALTPAHHWNDAIDELEGILKTAIALRQKGEIIKTIGEFLHTIEHVDTPFHLKLERDIRHGIRRLAKT